MATVVLAWVAISVGYNILSAPGTIFWVGIPFSTDLILTLTGIAVSIFLKNKSTDLTNIPPSLSTKNVSARGSTHVVVSTSLSSTNSVWTNLGTLVEIIVSSIDSIRPCAKYWDSAKVVSVLLLFVSLSDNLNSLLPVANFNTSFLGITKEPSSFPDASVVRAPAVLGCDVAPSCVTTFVWSENSTICKR